MERIIKITESELVSIVNKLINEQQVNDVIPSIDNILNSGGEILNLDTTEKSDDIRLQYTIGHFDNDIDVVKLTVFVEISDSWEGSPQTQNEPGESAGYELDVDWIKLTDPMEIRLSQEETRKFLQDNPKFAEIVSNNINHIDLDSNTSDDYLDFLLDDDEENIITPD